MSSTISNFQKPSLSEALFNRIFGVLVGLGIGYSHNYLLQVRGRKSGRLYSTPINKLDFDGKNYLVAPRGRTQWVRNAEAAGEVTLKKGSECKTFRIRPLSDGEKPPILKAYLERFHKEVQRYFAVRAGSSEQAFRAIVQNHPAYELLPKN